MSGNNIRNFVDVVLEPGGSLMVYQLRNGEPGYFWLDKMCPAGRGPFPTLMGCLRARSRYIELLQNPGICVRSNVLPFKRKDV